jgi:hypothetical protein
VAVGHRILLVFFLAGLGAGVVGSRPWPEKEMKFAILDSKLEPLRTEFNRQRAVRLLLLLDPT